MTPTASTDAATGSAETVFGRIRDHGAPAVALAARLLGRGAYEVSADGAVVQLSDGRSVLDLGSYGVTLLGHRHPAVVDAVASQLRRMPASTRLLANAEQAALQAELAAAAGPPYARVWLGSGGADAVEAALKLARRVTGRPGIVAAERAFHGKSLGALGATANPTLKAGFEAVSGQHIHRVDPTDPGAVARAVRGGGVAAVLLEPIQGEGGVYPLDRELLQQWTADAHAAGALVIADEVQTGTGRCDGLSVAVTDGLQPDLLLLGKALGGGVMPLSAVVATEAAAAPLRRDATMHTLTFGGHPLACAAGRSVLQLLPQLAGDHARLTAAFAAALPQLAARHDDLVSDVRGRGLLWGIELRTPGQAGELLLALAERDVLAAPCLSAPRVLRLFPPLTLTDAQATAVFAALDSALDHVRAAEHG